MVNRPKKTVRRALYALFLSVLAAVVVLVAAPPASAADYTQGVTKLSASSIQFWFKPTTPAALVDVHYTGAPGLGQQNFRMANNGGTWQQTVNGLSTGNVLSYWFTYEKGGPLFDTPHFSYTVGSGGGTTTPTTPPTTTPTVPTTPTTPPTPPTTGTQPNTNGHFPLILQNNTKGRWTNAQVYVTMLGMTSQSGAGGWFYLKPDGTMAHINHNDATAANHLTKNGVNYPNMSFSMAQASTITMPNMIFGGRIYISLGSPLFIPVSPDDQGWGGPDLHNAADPNNDVYYDWYEYTYGFGTTANYGGNTTQVDMFGFPMTARLQQAATGYDQTVGITLTRDQVMAQYTAAVGAAYKPLENATRIVAPRTSTLFEPGGAQANYLQAYIDQVWSYYTANQFTLTRLNQTFTGRVSGNTLTFTLQGGGPYFLNKPTTTDVMGCAGALANGTMTDIARALGAEFCAAFNRGVAQNTANWYNPAAYYTNSVQNDYAKFFHSIGIDHRSYAFAYDDINDQSSVKILGNNTPPSALTLGIGW